MKKIPGIVGFFASLVISSSCNFRDYNPKAEYLTGEIETERRKGFGYGARHFFQTHYERINVYGKNSTDFQDLEGGLEGEEMRGLKKMLGLASRDILLSLDIPMMSFAKKINQGYRDVASTPFRLILSDWKTDVDFLVSPKTYGFSIAKEKGNSRLSLEYRRGEDFKSIGIYLSFRH